MLYLCSVFVLDIKAVVPFSGTAAFFIGLCPRVKG